MFSSKFKKQSFTLFLFREYDSNGLATRIGQDIHFQYRLKKYIETSFNGYANTVNLDLGYGMSFGNEYVAAISYILHYIKDMNILDEFPELSDFLLFPPVTIFLDDKFNLKSSLFIDSRMNGCNLELININKIINNKTIIPKSLLSYYDVLEAYHDDKNPSNVANSYVDILKALFNYPKMEHSFELSISKDLGFLYPKLTTIEKEIEQMKNGSRTEIEHYLDTLGLAESFSELNITSTYELFNHMLNWLIETYPDISPKKYAFRLFGLVKNHLFIRYECDRHNISESESGNIFRCQFDKMCSFHQFNRNSRLFSSQNNILHLNHNSEHLDFLDRDFVRKYYQRTIFEHSNYEYIGAYLKAISITYEAFSHYHSLKKFCTTTIESLEDRLNNLFNQLKEYFNDQLVHSPLPDNTNNSVCSYPIYMSDNLDNVFRCFMVKTSDKCEIRPKLFSFSELDESTKDVVGVAVVGSEANAMVEHINKLNLYLKEYQHNDEQKQSINQSQFKFSNTNEELYDHLKVCTTSAGNCSRSFIVSDFVNFKYEQRCFFENGRIITTTPCIRKASFLHCYVNGRIHPYFVDNHTSKLHELTLDRKMAAEMAWFLRAAVRDYDKLLIKDGQDKLHFPRCGTIDVGYDIDNHCWKIIEIHRYSSIFNPYIGMYAANPFLFNHGRFDYKKKIKQLNNGVLDVKWEKTKKNSLLVDLLEIDSKI